MSGLSTAADGLFLDTNILVYSFDRQAGEKHGLAKSWLAGFWNQVFPPLLSVQILQEFHVTLVRLGQPVEIAAGIVRDFLAWPVVANTTSVFQSAIEIQARYQLSFWDANVIAAAVAGGCDRLWTEDLNPGQVYEGVTAINPFERGVPDRL